MNTKLLPPSASIQWGSLYGDVLHVVEDPKRTVCGQVGKLDVVRGGASTKIYSPTRPRACKACSRILERSGFDAQENFPRWVQSGPRRRL